MNEITMYTTQTCPYCQRAEQLLRQKGVDQLNTIRVDLEPDKMSQMIAVTGRRTVPQIFIGALHVGGYDDLVARDRAGQLDGLLYAHSPDTGAA